MGESCIGSHYADLELYREIDDRERWRIQEELYDFAERGDPTRLGKSRASE
jgi:hypothetical protein